jgi:NAD(P)-dependent dehydrogenase (short-subunit alcohol dehydrogenase family)
MERAMSNESPTPGVRDAAALFSLEGRVALVTGASSGIGRRMASVLAAAGATVCVGARRVDLLSDLAANNPSIYPYMLDVSDDAACESIVRSIVQTHGRLDILVNNAGISNIARAEEETTADFRSVVNVNLVAPFVLAAAAGRQMLTQQTGGVVVNVASIVGLVGLGRMPQAAYASSKAGLVNLTREIAAQWARKGVRVNAIAPGWFETELTAELFASEAGTEWVSRLTPMGRQGRLDELDGAVLFLSSDASSYVTGAVLTVDGGWTAV